MRLELRNRLIFGFGIGGLVVAGVVHDMMRQSHLAVLMLGLIGVIAGCNEFTRLARAHAAHVRMAPMVVVCVLLVLEAHLHPSPVPRATGGDPVLYYTIGSSTPCAAWLLPTVPLILGIGLAWTVLAQMFRYATENFFANVGATVFGMTYLGISVNLLQRLALSEGPGNPNRGTALVLLFIAATKLGDVGAYFGGRALGRHKMAPRISPGKTWEGFAFSFVGSVGGVQLFMWLYALCGVQPLFDAWWKPVVWALVLGPLGVAGDLAESCMKRDAAVKDSGAALPGFGGFLDILDALILAAPVAFLLAMAL